DVGLLAAGVAFHQDLAVLAVGDRQRGVLVGVRGAASTAGKFAPHLAAQPRNDIGGGPHGSVHGSETSSSKRGPSTGPSAGGRFQSWTPALGSMGVSGRLPPPVSPLPVCTKTSMAPTAPNCSSISVLGNATTLAAPSRPIQYRLPLALCFS